MHTPHANSSSSLSMAVQLGVKCCGLFGTNICQPDQNLPSMPSNEEPPDSGHAMHEFLIHAGQVFEEARFLASSIPNASTEASQHAILQLETIEFVLNTMEMGFDSDSITPMKHDLNTILSLLQQHIKPSDQSATGSLPWIHTGKHGQPQLDIVLILWMNLGAKEHHLPLLLHPWESQQGQFTTICKLLAEPQHAIHSPKCQMKILMTWCQR